MWRLKEKCIDPDEMERAALLASPHLLGEVFPCHPEHPCKIKRVKRSTSKVSTLAEPQMPAIVILDDFIGRVNPKWQT